MQLKKEPFRKRWNKTRGPFSLQAMLTSSGWFISLPHLWYHFLQYGIVSATICFSFSIGKIPRINILFHISRRMNFFSFIHFRIIIVNLVVDFMIQSLYIVLERKIIPTRWLSYVLLQFEHQFRFRGSVICTLWLVLNFDTTSMDLLKFANSLNKWMKGMNIPLWRLASHLDPGWERFDKASNQIWNALVTLHYTLWTGSLW